MLHFNGIKHCIVYSACYAAIDFNIFLLFMFESSTNCREGKLVLKVTIWTRAAKVKSHVSNWLCHILISSNKKDVVFNASKHVICRKNIQVFDMTKRIFQTIQSCQLNMSNKTSLRSLVLPFWQWNFAMVRQEILTI